MYIDRYVSIHIDIYIYIYRYRYRYRYRYLSRVEDLHVSRESCAKAAMKEGLKFPSAQAPRKLEMIADISLVLIYLLNLQVLSHKYRENSAKAAWDCHKYAKRGFPHGSNG